MTAYLTLFGIAFAAASFLPFYSELYLAALLSQDYNPLSLWLYATAGNTLGALVNYGLAHYALHFQDRRWFPVKPHQLESSQRWFNRFGKWSLLMAWAPVGGDALTFIAGLMRVNIGLFLLLVGIGKGARYAVFIWTYQEVGDVVSSVATLPS